jgi:hypothetical protein
MTSKLVVSGLAGLLTLFCLVLEQARATTVYTYTGNFFNQFVNSTPPDGMYDSSMRVTGSFEVANPLAPNLSFENIKANVLHFSFSDGRNQLTDLNSPFPLFDQFFTDGLGNITAWNIGLSGIGNTGTNTTERHVFTFFEPFFPLNNPGIDHGLIAVCTDFQSGLGCVTAHSDDGIIQSSPGQWTITTLPEVPLPAALPLFATGLGVLGLLGWRRKRKAASLAA